MVETLDLQTQWMSVIQTRSPGSLSGIEITALSDSSLLPLPMLSPVCPILMYTS